MTVPCAKPALADHPEAEQAWAGDPEPAEGPTMHPGIRGGAESQGAGINTCARACNGPGLKGLGWVNRDGVMVATGGLTLEGSTGMRGSVGGIPGIGAILGGRATML